MIDQKFQVAMNWFKKLLNRYFWVIEVADCKFLVRITKFKMSDYKCIFLINLAKNQR